MYRAWLSILLAACLRALLCHADEKSFLKNAKFNEGEYGNYPKHKFRTSIIEPPRLNFMEPFTNCDDGSYIFVAPRGAAAWSSFYILDHEGGLIWGPDHRYGEVYNFQMQLYKGQPYLFFWAGDDSVGGHGEGKYFMLDQHYEEHRKLSAGQGIRGDLHTFFITKEDTAVFTGYQVMQADLTGVGGLRDSWIWESIFQEMDVETGEVLFQWRSSDHFPFEDSYGDPNAATHGNPWDYFHINMVDKDKAGNYFVSTRYGRCVLYISKDDGSILWQLGGKGNSFKDLSDGDATTFLGQHDVHWVEERSEITMFDNRADWTNKLEDESVGHRIHLNLAEMTAELVQSYRHPAHILSTSQGSMQNLPNGNVLLGYGFNGAFSEFSPDGELLCDATMMPRKRFGSGDVQSYRDLKFNWTGIPLTVPSLHFEENKLYISWLGSTKVRGWMVQDSDAADGLFNSVQTIKKNGFETEFALEDGPRMRKYVRVVAVDLGGTQLSISNPVDIVDPVEIWGVPKPGEPLHHIMSSTGRMQKHNSGSTTGMSGDEDDDTDNATTDAQLMLLLGGLTAVCAAIVLWMIYGRGRGGSPYTQSEKTFTPSRFRDTVSNGRLWRLWHRIRIRLPGSQSWHYGKLPITTRDELGANGHLAYASSSSDRSGLED